MGKTLEEMMAELEKKARERMKASQPDSSATIYENNGATVPENSNVTVCEGSNVTIPEPDATICEDGDITVPGNETVSEKPVRERNSGVYEKGQTILDTYTVESDPIHGGMGSVWRVHHNGWNVELAMKRPQAKLFQSERQKENFIGECEAWINLGLHPNIVSCYYVREIDGVPTIFSEWMENGSLENHIQKGTLYSGTEQEQQERPLDIAIQFARGLHYAHEQGLIHQDVKPDNVLLSKDWDAKVADFGLAKARAVLTVLEGEDTVRDAGATVMAPSGGYTPAYCSMEQMDGKPLTRRTDIYSWAVSVMEMYIGSRPWMNGVVAGLSCRNYFDETSVPLPEALKTLLAQCMAAEPEDRPHDFTEIEAELQKIYRAATGSDYPRPVSTAAADTADSLNNRALSYLDMGKPDAAEAVWKQALEKDGSRFLFHYNYAVFLWNARKMSDAAFVRYLKSHGDGSELFHNSMKAVSRMRGEWDEKPMRYAYEEDKRPADREPLLHCSNVSVDGRYQVWGYCDRLDGEEQYGYRIKDIVTGEVRDYPNDFPDYGKSTPRDRMHCIYPHYYKSDTAFFCGPNSELVVMLADVLWFFSAKTGRLILSMPPETDGDGDSKCYLVHGFTNSGKIEYQLKAIIPSWEHICEITLLPDEEFPYLLSGVETVEDRLSAEQSTKENYLRALHCWEKSDIAGAFRELNRSLETKVLTFHEPSMRLWSKLGNYYQRGKLIAVIPTEDDPSSLPIRSKRVTIQRPDQTEGGKNLTDNGQTEISVYATQESQEYDEAMDMFEYVYSFSLTAKDLYSGNTYFTIENMETAEEADWNYFTTDRYLLLDGEKMLRYSRSPQGGEWIDLSLRTPHFALPGGCELFNMENGVNIGGFVFDDKFDDFRPLWNADVIACRNHNYRLIYRYLIPDKT